MSSPKQYLPLERVLLYKLLEIVDSHYFYFIVCFYRKKSGKLKASFKRDCFSLGSNVDIDFSGPTIYGWAVLAFEGWLAGYQMSFDTAKSKLSQNNFALGYKAADFQLHTHV